MAQDNELQLALKIEADNSVDNAAKKLDKVSDAYDNVANAAKKASKETADAMDGATRNQKQLTDAVEDTTQALKRQADAANDARRQTQLDIADKSGNNAGIAGQTRGALDALTGGNAGAIGQVLEVSEAVFDLGEAAGKVGGPLGDVITKLGPGGLVGVAAVAAVAVAAVGLAFKKFNDDAKKQADELNAVIDTRRGVAQDIASGLGSDEASARVEELNRQREAEAQLLADLKQRYDENITAQNALGETVLKLTPQEQALADQIKESESAIAGYNTEQQLLQTALENGTLAANDAAAAERELAAERTQGILTEAAQAGELESQRLRLADATKEQIAAELQSLEVRKAGLEAELASLQASGDTSEEVKNRIQQLTESIGFLGEQATQLNSLRASAKTDKQVQAEKELAAAREETATASAKAAKSELSRFGQRRADSARNRSAGVLSFGFLTGASQADKADTNEIEKQLRDTQNSIIKVNNDYEERRVQQVIDNNRRLIDIARDFGDSRADALEEGNFLALDKLNTQEDRAERDQLIANKRANQDRLREQQNALRTLQQQEQQFHNQRLQVNQQGFQAALNQQQQFINAFIGNFSNMFGALSGRSGIRRPATP